MNSNHKTDTSSAQEVTSTPSATTDAAASSTSVQSLLVATPPDVAFNAVLVKSEDLPADTPKVRGYDFNQGINYDDLFASFATTGFQATNLNAAINEVNRMLSWRLSDEPLAADEEDEPERANIKCAIFLGFTSNMVSSGVREIIRFLVQNKLVDCLVTTGGAIEEDIMKCLNPHFMGDFKLNGKVLRTKGLNRIGNLLVPNKNYCAFDDWIMPVLDRMVDEQKDGVLWSPSKMIKRFGEVINHPDSIWYWAAKNDIPVFCPAITDGSVGDMIYFHSYRKPGLVVDLVSDIRAINSIATFAKKTGMLVLGGGLVKHHVCNANLMRNGADFSVFINTAHDYDGSDAGATPDEAISWGKIRIDAKPVKIHGEATLLFPLLVAQTFAKVVEKRKQAEEAAKQANPTPAPAPVAAPRY